METGEIKYKNLAIILALVYLCSFIIAFSTQDGSLILSSTTFSQTVWDDLRVPLSSARNPSSAPGYDAFKNGTKAWAFDKTSDEMLYFETQLPHTYKFGTKLHAHIHWAPIDTGTNGVVWCLEYTIQYINGGAYPASSTECVRQVGAGVAYGHQIAEIVEIPGITGSVSAVLVGRLFRDANSSEAKGTDDYDADAFGLSFDIHYEIDSFGSRQETVK